MEPAVPDGDGSEAPFVFDAAAAQRLLAGAAALKTHGTAEEATSSIAAAGSQPMRSSPVGPSTLARPTTVHREPIQASHVAAAMEATRAVTAASAMESTRAGTAAAAMESARADTAATAMDTHGQGFQAGSKWSGTALGLKKRLATEASTWARPGAGKTGSGSPAAPPWMTCPSSDPTSWY